MSTLAGGAPLAQAGAALASTPAPRPRAGSRFRDPALALMLPAAVLLVWHLASVGQKYSLIPSPADVGRELYDLAFGGIYDDAYSGTLLDHALTSLARVYGGFALAALLALPLGLMIGRIGLVRRLIEPTLLVLRPIPVTAWLPLAMIMFGLGPTSAVFLVFLGAFYPIIVNTTFGVRSVEGRLFEAASMLGCRGTAQFFRVVLPASLPSIFTGLRLGLGVAWMVIVVGEMTGVQVGLGALIMEARQLSRTEIILAAMLVIGVLGFLSDQVVVLIARRLLAWSPSNV